MNTAYPVAVFISLLLFFLPSHVQSDRPWSQVCTQEDVKDLPFCNVHLDVPNRVADYVQRVPTQQQMAMMNHQAAGFPDLYIPPYQWWSEGLHGAAQSCVTHTLSDASTTSPSCICPTSFPAPTGLGATWNRTLWHFIGQAIGKEGVWFARNRNHDGSIGDGLTYWSPTINLQRDPRWGRNQEVPGEDPLVTGAYAVAFVQGLQAPQHNNNNDNSIRIAAACKHYLGNSLEKWANVTRHDFDALISPVDLQTYYAVPFQACVTQGKVLGVVCSYNRINGIPACAHDELLQRVLRDQYGFEGYVTSDCGALDDIEHGHHYATSPAQAAALALNATTDLNCGTGDYYPKGLHQAWMEGLVTARQIQESFARLATVQMKLGLFDSQRETNIEPERPMENDEKDIDAYTWQQEHAQLAYEAALQSIVLLKNQDGVLPLDASKPAKIALIGPHVNATEAFLSNYHGQRCCSNGNSKYSCMTTPFQAIQDRHPAGTLESIQGCNVDGMAVNEIHQAVVLAAQSDIVLVFVGLDNTQESEGLDRIETTLPGLQQELVHRVLAVGNPNTILILLNGGALSLGSYILDQAPAIVETFYGGQEGARAMASVLYGDYNPTGRLVATMYPPAYVHQIPLTEMGLTVGVGRTYRHYKGTPEFAFGHGLSYSRFSIEMGGSNRNSFEGANQSFAFEVEVTNEGPMDGGYTVLFFWAPVAKHTDWNKKLFAFDSIPMLHVGASATLSATLDIQELVDHCPNVFQYRVWAEGMGGIATADLVVDLWSLSEAKEVEPLM